VRRHAAEQLYLQLLGLEPAWQEAADEVSPTANVGKAGSAPGALSAQALEDAQDLLLATPWDAQLEEVYEARSALAALLGVQVRLRSAGRPASAGAASTTGAGDARHVARAGEHASYQSLLDDAARGGGY
jgi:hypothetical protein